MAKRLVVGALPVGLPDEPHAEFTLAINEPGRVRAVGFTSQERLVMVRGEPAFDEVFTMFVEVSPSGAKRNRRFLAMRSGAAVDVPSDYDAEYIATAVSARSGQAIHLYEIKAVS